MSGIGGRGRLQKDLRKTLKDHRKSLRECPRKLFGKVIKIWRSNARKIYKGIGQILERSEKDLRKKSRNYLEGP